LSKKGENPRRGSDSNLQAFNTEQVAEAIFTSPAGVATSGAITTTVVRADRRPRI